MSDSDTRGWKKDRCGYSVKSINGRDYYILPAKEGKFRLCTLGRPTTIHDDFDAACEAANEHAKEAE